MPEAKPHASTTRRRRAMQRVLKAAKADLADFLVAMRTFGGGMSANSWHQRSSRRKMEQWFLEYIRTWRDSLLAGARQRAAERIAATNPKR
jgi:hypothetical protein